MCRGFSLVAGATLPPSPPPTPGPQHLPPSLAHGRCSRDCSRPGTLALPAAAPSPNGLPDTRPSARSLRSVLRRQGLGGPDGHAHPGPSSYYLQILTDSNIALSP